MTIFFIQFQLLTVFVLSKTEHIFSPVSVEIRQKTEPQQELRLCAIHFKRKTYRRFQVVHSACIWKHHHSHSHVSQKGWEEEN